MTLARAIVRASSLSKSCFKSPTIVRIQERGNSTSSIIDVSPLADTLRAQVRRYTGQLPTNQEVRLVGIMAQRDDVFQMDAEVYSNRIADCCRADGIAYELRRCPAEYLSDVETAIQETNARPDVHGILVFYPIFKRDQQQRGANKGSYWYLDRSTGVHYKSDDDYLRDVVEPSKDVEGLCNDYNARRVFRARGKGRTNHEVFVPCTALSVMQILRAYHASGDNGTNLSIDELLSLPHTERFAGCTATVVNRSEILGRPLAALLALEGATVYSVDEFSVLMFMPGGRMRRCADLTLIDCLAQSSIIVTGVPSRDFVLPLEPIMAGATVVDVSEFGNVIQDEILKKSAIRLVPQIGKTTVATLESNLIRLHQRSLAKANSN